MPVAQNTPRIPRGIHHAFTKWKTRMLTREAAPTATTDSRIEIGIGATMLGYFKCLPNQPASNESNRHIFDEETASAGTEQAARDTSAYRFHLVRRRQGSRSPQERTHFDNTISIALTFVARPSSAVPFSVAMRTSRTSASGMKRPRTISATSTAREIERPRALTTTSRDPPLKYVTTAST